jgi:His-Xaa-Ser system protein HxsD
VVDLIDWTSLRAFTAAEPMSLPQAILPADLVTVDLGSSSIALRIDSTLYPLSALYAAAYVFIDRCFVLLDRPDSTHYRVSLSPKKGGATGEALTAYAGEFANELLSCTWRAKIAEESRGLIEAATAQALRGAMGAPSLDDLEKFDFSEEAFEDPLGIAMSWEEKYGKKKSESTESGDAAPKEPS